MFFRLLLIFFIIYLVVRFIQSFTKPAQQKSKSQFYGDSNARKEGDVTVTKSTDPEKKITNNEGDYIDYEDV